MSNNQNQRLNSSHVPRVVLITGGCGYLGSALVRAFARDERFEGSTTRILDNMQAANYTMLMALPDTGRCQFIEGDILDPTAVELALQGVDAVVHLAAIVRSPISFENPAWMEQVNHWGTVRLIEECLAAGVTRFIHASTTAVYGVGGSFKEKDMCRPVGPYAQSKHQAEQSILATQERGLKPTLLRMGTIYGYASAMRFDTVPNRFVYLAGIGQSLAIYGDGKQKRPLVHVDDASKAILFALYQPEETTGIIFNIVCENASVLEMVEAVRVARPDISIRYTDQNVLTHISFEVDATTIAGLGFRPERCLRDGVAELTNKFRGLEYFMATDFEM